MAKIGLREVTRLRTASQVLDGAGSIVTSRRALLPLHAQPLLVQSGRSSITIRTTGSGVRALSRTTRRLYHAPNSQATATGPNSTTDPRNHEGDDQGKDNRTSALANETAKRSVPGAAPPQGSLSIVFTDIVKSTSIWETDASAMMQAMHLHDHMIRHLTESNQGYEVKQNGDGFMIAFPTATSAVQFCLDVQEQLLDENWPREILKLPPGQETKDSDGHLLFRGLQLRMSAHWGTPVCNWNEVIQRMDYLGPMVNRAARFIEATEAGQIVVSEDFLRQLQDELEKEARQGEQDQPQKTQHATSSDACSGDTHHDNSNENTNHNHESVNLGVLRSKRGQQKLTHQRFEIRLLGDHEFKGLDEPQKLYYLVPRSLEGRADHWHRVTHVPGVKGNVRGGGPS